MSFNIIGIHGRPHAGKDTICDHICTKYNMTREGPSVYVKRAAAATFGVPESCFYDPAIKDTVDPFWKISYREMAQKVGKEGSRDLFGEDFWLRHVERNFSIHDQCTGIVLADIRYANEVEWVKKHNGVVVFVIRDYGRPIAANEKHVAEQGLPIALADVVIHNNGTIDQLLKSVDSVVKPRV